ERRNAAAAGDPCDCEFDSGSDDVPLRVFVSISRVSGAADAGVLLAVFHDVTARWTREQEFAELAKFPLMNPKPVLRFDPGGVVVLANKAACTLFGSESLMGRSWIGLCPGVSEAFWARVRIDERPPQLETEIGDRCVVFTHVRSSDGRIVLAFGEDTTAFRRAEYEINEKAELLAELARFPDMNPGPVIRTGEDGVIVMSTPAARRVFGDELLGKCWKDLCPGVGCAWEKIIAAEEAPLVLEARVAERDYVFAHRHDRKSQLIFVFGADVSNEKKAEEALRRSEKMATLGTLAAGVAHELNNPAAETRRAADQLASAFERLEAAYVVRDGANFTSERREVLRQLEEAARAKAGVPFEMDAMVRSDREAELEEWLENRDVPDPWAIAPQLVRIGFDVAELDRAAAALNGEALTAAMVWVGATFPVYALLYEIANGSSRISEIVGALKSYSYLGQAPVQAVDLREGINNTLIILRSKMKRGVHVTREYADDVPPVPAYGSELNQVWTNLLDNAIGAMDGDGNIRIKTRRVQDWAVVEIEDDGPGIPEEHQSRVFDPFFTTKEPGKGTGLGLSTTFSIVTERHRGEISVQSRPGSTRFTVRLPLETAAAVGARFEEQPNEEGDGEWQNPSS
ncbi:MAG: ATP-binding protein, partial [Proteobacteria bacterium]|nr:ATP-binding protein [Pseudomonadota bacterium]